MIGEEILDQQIGKPLKDGKFECMQMDDQSPEAINVTYLQFFDQWLRIVTTDGQTKIVFGEPKEVLTTFKGSTFRYFQSALDVFPGFRLHTEKRLMKFVELLSSKTGQSFGIKLYFEGGGNIVIRNHDYPIDKTEYIFDNSQLDGLAEK